MEKIELIDKLIQRDHEVKELIKSRIQLRKQIEKYHELYDSKCNCDVCWVMRYEGVGK